MIYMYVHMSVSHCLDDCGFVVSFKIGMSESSNFILFQDCFGSSQSLAFPSVSTKKKKGNWVLIGCLKGVQPAQLHSWERGVYLIAFSDNCGYSLIPTETSQVVVS